MSIESQRLELMRSFSTHSGIEIVEVIEESKSAKSPGRPAFDRMIRRLESGEAEGLLAWAPDRLARNSVDGGRVVYLLDVGILKDLKFSTYTFENNPQGKFMLSIMFGQSKYYSDALSENVKRGLRTKIEKGWRPARPPIGYMTDPATRQVVPNPTIFPLIQRLFDLAGSGNYSVKQLAVLARDDWGFRMPDNRRSRGQAIGVSTLYRLLKNPFYAGAYYWKGTLHKGAHTPAVSMETYKRAQRALGIAEKPRPKKHQFPFTGLIRCGSCGLMVTAELRRKPSGRTYAYYHCTKRALGPRCAEPAVSATDLERQFEDFLASIVIQPAVADFVDRMIDDLRADHNDFEEARQLSLNHALSDLDRQQQTLTQLRLKDLLGDAEFVKERDRLTRERLALEEQRLEPTDPKDRFELVRSAILFNKYAVEWFRNGDVLQKRQILKTVGSNPTLSGKILSIQATELFQLTLKTADDLLVCGIGESDSCSQFGKLMFYH